MKSTAVWIKGFQSKVDDGRGHDVTIDLPKSQNGEDLGATALDLALMGLSGCISTIFALVADKSKLNFEELEAEVEAEKGKLTIETAHIKVTIKTDDAEKAKKTLDKTLAICPVGVLYEQAGVKITHELIIK